MTFCLEKIRIGGQVEDGHSEEEEEEEGEAKKERESNAGLGLILGWILESDPSLTPVRFSGMGMAMDLKVHLQTGRETGAKLFLALRAGSEIFLNIDFFDLLFFFSSPRFFFPPKKKIFFLFSKKDR